jgi:putative sterol carrier protein
MADYLYKTIIYHDDTNVVETPTNNDTDNTDFETNNKSSAVSVNEVVISSTTFVIELSYSDFDDLITGDVAWTDVKYIEDAKAYCLFLASETEL